MIISLLLKDIFPFSFKFFSSCLRLIDLILLYGIVNMMQTDIRSIRSQPNMRYAEISGKVYSRKSDYVESIVRACAREFSTSGSCFTTIFQPFRFLFCASEFKALLH